MAPMEVFFVQMKFKYMMNNDDNYERCIRNVLFACVKINRYKYVQIHVNEEHAHYYNDLTEIIRADETVCLLFFLSIFITIR